MAARSSLFHDQVLLACNAREGVTPETMRTLCRIVPNFRGEHFRVRLSCLRLSIFFEIYLTLNLVLLESSSKRSQVILTTLSYYFQIIVVTLMNEVVSG